MRGPSWKYRDDYVNEAPLKALMTALPMTAAQHAALLQKRIDLRRKMESAKELKVAEDDNLW